MPLPAHVRAIDGQRAERADDTNVDQSLETALKALEARLASLQLAVLDGDAIGIESESNALRQQLAAATPTLMNAAHDGRLPRALRRQLAQAGARVTAQREALARALGALDRAIDVLVTHNQAGHGLYVAEGVTERVTLGASATA